MNRKKAKLAPIRVTGEMGEGRGMIGGQILHLATKCPRLRHLPIAP
jgi:hypothetical protein